MLQSNKWSLHRPLPNKRLKLAGAPKQGRIPFVRQIKYGQRITLRHACGRCARSLSAVR